MGGIGGGVWGVDGAKDGIERRGAGIRGGGGGGGKSGSVFFFSSSCSSKSNSSSSSSLSEQYMSMSTVGKEFALFGGVVCCGSGGSFVVFWVLIFSFVSLFVSLISTSSPSSSLSETYISPMH